MGEQFIDIHNLHGRYARARERLLADPRITPGNKELIERFLREAALGKTVVGKAKKKIGPARLINYTKHFIAMAGYLPADLTQATHDEIERLVVSIESDQIRSRTLRVIDGCRRPTHALLSPQYKSDLKVTIKKFYKWLLGGCRVYPELVEWIDTYVQHREMRALSESEISTILERATSTFDRAFVQVLYDGGFRVGEILNVRLRHVTLVPVDPAEPGKRCFMIHIPFSKSIRRTVALPMPATLKWLKAWLEEHPARPLIGPDGALTAADPDALLFHLSFSTCQQRLRRLGVRVLGRAIHPHLLRHSSATFWSNRLSYFQQCKRFGWTLTSKMPQRYIDRQGIDELNVAREFLASI